VSQVVSEIGVRIMFLVLEVYHYTYYQLITNPSPWVNSMQARALVVDMVVHLLVLTRRVTCGRCGGRVTTLTISLDQCSEQVV